MSAPTFAPVAEDTASLLDLIAEERPATPSEREEWDWYVACLREVAGNTGLIDPNHLRPLLRGRVMPRRIGAFAHRALRSGLVAYTGDYVISDDAEGRNGGKPARVMRWTGSTS